MNQAILLNDDLNYCCQTLQWQCTGMLSGEKITIFINSAISPQELTQAIKFDWEMAIEDWLEDNEPNIHNQIKLTL